MKPKALAHALALLFLAFAGPAAAQPASRTEIEKADFFKEGMAPVRKDEGYDLTILYFMDYQCPSCRQYTPDVAKALGEDKKLRVIYRDTPIFGPRSEAAARAAIASQFQGKHEAFHHALMTTKLPLDEPAIEAAAKKAGVNWQRLQADIAKHRKEIDRQLERNMALSEATGISGTPAFIIGNRLSDGALEYKDLKAEMADARAETVATPDATPGAAAPEDGKAPEANKDQPEPTTNDAPVFERSPPRATQSEPVPQPESPGARHPWLALVIGLGALLAASLAWLIHRRRRRMAARQAG